MFLIGITILIVYFKSVLSKTHYKPISLKEMILAFTILAQFSLMPVISYYFGSECSFAMFIIANISMLGYSAVMMDEGLKTNSSAKFFLGVSTFLLWTIVRYFDLFGNVGGMLGAALLFFLSSLALIGLAFFWRQRKAAFHVN